MGETRAKLQTLNAAVEEAKAFESELEGSNLLVSAREQQAIATFEDEVRITLKNPEELRVYVVPRRYVLEIFEKKQRPPVFQDLRKEGRLKPMTVKKKGVLQGELTKPGKTVLAVSYPWQGRGDPDSTHDRLEAVVKHLRENENIDYVWWDFMCVPQTTNEPDADGNPPSKPYPT